MWKRAKRKAPDNVKAPVQYGTSVKAFTVMLNNGYKIPFKKIQLLFSDMFGYPINESTVYRANQVCYEKLEKSENNNSKWAKVFKLFLLNLYQMPIEKRIEQKQVILSRFDSICNIAQKAEPPPKRVSKRGRAKRTKGRNLLERLIKYKPAVLAFAFNQEVPFTNNLAERDIRPAKVPVPQGV